MIFGGIFKKWFGGGQRKRAARLEAIAALKLQTDEQEDDNLPGVDPNPDDTAGQDGITDNPTTPGDTPTGSDEPLLAFDRNGDGVIDPETELSFLEDSPSATTNFQALESFDTNADNLFDANDPQFHKFGVWTDFNRDAQFQADEFKTLTELGIVSVDLSKGLVDGSLSITRSDESEGLLKLQTTASATI